jgi:dTDP-glucose pyrophosphorylase
MINLIPMAGEGSRFKNEGYTTPKPLIEVDGKPMVINAANSLPKGEKYIFICRENKDKKEIEKIINNNLENTQYIYIDKLTEGQASTCLLAKEYINNDEELMVAASDNGMVWNQEKFERLKKEVDCLVWSFRSNQTVVEKPEAYGWCKVDGDNNVIEVSVKKKISNDPINDHAVVGGFWFKNGSILVEAIEKMIKENRRVNGEFYVDEAINDVLDLGYKVKVMEADKYICWGTPNDLKTYNYWKEFFNEMLPVRYNKEFK